MQAWFQRFFVSMVLESKPMASLYPRCVPYCCVVDPALNWRVFIWILSQFTCHQYHLCLAPFDELWKGWPPLCNRRGQYTLPTHGHGPPRLLSLFPPQALWSASVTWFIVSRAAWRQSHTFLFLHIYFSIQFLWLSVILIFLCFVNDVMHVGILFFVVAK